MPTILVIDDEPLVRETVEAALTRHGYTVLTAKDGQAGMMVMTANRVDLVVLDIVMPVQEGLETIQYLRKISATLPILAISGSGRRGSADFLEAAQLLGATSALAKPFRPDQIVAAVAALLSGAGRPSDGAQQAAG